MLCEPLASGAVGVKSACGTDVVGCYGVAEHCEAAGIGDWRDGDDVECHVFKEGRVADIG